MPMTFTFESYLMQLILHQQAVQGACGEIQHNRRAVRAMCLIIKRIFALFCGYIAIEFIFTVFGIICAKDCASGYFLKRCRHCAKCEDCGNGHFRISCGNSSAGECLQHTDCDNLGMTVKVPGTPTADTQCDNDKQCTCKGGAGATG